MNTCVFYFLTIPKTLHFPVLLSRIVSFPTQVTLHFLFASAELSSLPAIWVTPSPWASPLSLPTLTWLHHSTSKSHVSLSFSKYKFLCFTHPLCCSLGLLGLLFKFTKMSSSMTPQFSFYQFFFPPVSVPSTTSLVSLFWALVIHYLYHLLPLYLPSSVLPLCKLLSGLHWWLRQ